MTRKENVSGDTTGFDIGANKELSLQESLPPVTVSTNVLLCINETAGHGSILAHTYIYTILLYLYKTIK